MFLESLNIVHVCKSGNISLVEKYGIEWVKVKIKCNLVHALRLCTGRTAHRGSRGIAILYRH